MSNLIFSPVDIHSDLNDVFKVMKELRTDLNMKQFEEIFQLAKTENNYELVKMLDEKGNILGLMGFRLLYDFVHKKHLYIDDLIIAEAHRSKSLGAKFLQYAEEKAQELNCHGLRLCTGNDNHRGIEFYKKNNWSQRALVFKKKLIG